MIRQLRRWHRRWFVLLAIALPILLFLALRQRPLVPPVDDLPDAAQASPTTPTAGEAR